MDILTHILDLIETEHPGITSDRTRLERILRTQFGRDRHYIASSSAIDRAERNARIVSAMRSGASARDVAARFGVSRKHVYDVTGAALKG